MNIILYTEQFQINIDSLSIDAGRSSLGIVVQDDTLIVMKTFGAARENPALLLSLVHSLILSKNKHDTTWGPDDRCDGAANFQLETKGGERGRERQLALDVFYILNTCIIYFIISFMNILYHIKEVGQKLNTKNIYISLRLVLVMEFQMLSIRLIHVFIYLSNPLRTSTVQDTTSVNH